MASYAVGRVLVEKCLRAGYSCALWTRFTHKQGEATELFQEALESQDFLIYEPRQVSNRYTLPNDEQNSIAPPAVD